MSRTSKYGVTTKLRMRPVWHDGWWKIEAALLVRGKWNVLLRQGEYDSETEAQEALDKKLEKVERMKRCASKTMKTI